MLTSVYVGGKRVTLDPKQSVGQGGEAEVYKFGDNQVLKVYKRPEDFDGNDEASKRNRAGAVERLKVIQKKLPAFPHPAPAGVVAPLELAYDKASGGQVVGFTMPFVTGSRMLSDYADISFCQQSGISNAQKMNILRSLHEVVRNVHAAGMVIGDFNSFNVLVHGDQAWLHALLIDADSMQYGGFVCSTFTQRYVDPLICDPNKGQPIMVKPHSQNSDWLAFDMMCMELLLFVHPYTSGNHRPPGGKNERVSPLARPLKRLWVGHEHIKYPNAGVPLGYLSDAWRSHFEQRFAGSDLRGLTPLSLLERDWQVCSDCGVEHQQNRCPGCSKAVLIPITPPRASYGTVTFEKIFETNGVLLQAVVQGGVLRYLYHENNAFMRERGRRAFSGSLSADTTFCIHGEETLVGKGAVMVRLDVSGNPAFKFSADRLRGKRAQVASDGEHFYFARGGQLHRQTKLGSLYIGDVLEDQTVLWSGEQFGISFYQAGSLRRAAVFRKDRDDLIPVQLPRLQGKLMELAAYFSEKRCWLFLVRDEGGKRFNHCFVINSRGEVLAEGQAQEGDGSWLGQPIRSGKCAASMAGNEILFAVTDQGLAPIVLQNGQLAEGSPMVGTEDIVETSDQLLIAREGMYVVRSREILLLKTR